ncbi:DUF7287 family protein [Haloarcula marina]|uniref:DUF7287 family protein n=1 Tax=Haloarcula marina TaxID=2961574 RepID=UPI0020B7D2A3|nr:hypothetical protein [Halomicroarcula marina]
MRGQTTLDFAIGMSLFLAVLVFVFLFVPGLLSPFTEGAQEETVTTNRVADQLSKSMLGSPRRPQTLDTHCTVTFFEHTAPAPDRCRFTYESSVEAQLGLDAARQNVNITLRGNVTDGGIEDEILCWDGGDGTLVNATDTGSGPAGCDDGNDVVLTRGDAPPTANDDSVTALRVALLDGQDVTMYVEMW